MLSSRYYYRLAGAFLISFFSFTMRTNAQDMDSKIRAVFIYNFTKHINWPESAAGTNLVIGVVGDETIAAELEKMTAGAKSGSSRNLVIKRVASGNLTGPLTSYHILYFSNKETETIKGLADASAKASVMLISEGMGTTRKGSTISFFKDENNKIKFELNKRSLEERNLKASGDLLRLAILVEN